MPVGIIKNVRWEPGALGSVIADQSAAALG
jgi:hypothetical protein